MTQFAPAIRDVRISPLMKLNPSMKVKRKQLSLFLPSKMTACVPVSSDYREKSETRSTF